MSTEANNTSDAVQVVTSETLHEFLGITPAETKEPEVTPEPEKPEDPPAEQESEEETEEVEAKKEEPEKGKPGRPKKALQDRMRELTERAKQAEADRERYRQDLERERKAREELEAKTKPEEPQKESNARPDPNDFKDAFEYAEALSEWKVQEALRAKDREAQERIEAQRRQEVERNWNEKLADAKKLHEDYDDVLASAEGGVSDEIRDAIVESDIGPDILYHLAANPEIVSKINGLSTRNALKELGRIEAQLELARKALTEPPKPKAEPEVSKAPAPIKPIKQANRTATFDGMIDANGNWTGSPEDYRAYREAQQRRH